MVIAALEKLSPQTHHFWVDTWCIDQENDIDKHRQIRSMGDIYRAADFVLVTLHHRLNHTQSDLDDIMSKLSKLADIHGNGEAWGDEFVEYLGSTEVVEPIVRAFAFLQSLMQSAWPTRLWCFQEAALAERILWIGLDRVPLHISDETAVAILDVPSLNPQLELRLGPQFHSSTLLVKPLLDHRLGWSDPTCVMEAAHLRHCTVQEDEIYGLMGASGVTIEPEPTKSREMLWHKWWKESIRLDHIRWLMLSWNSDYPYLNRNTEDAIFGCVSPPFRKRTQASKSSVLHAPRPYGAVEVGEDCVKVEGYCVGKCASFVYLGSATKVSDIQSCFMTVICLGRGDLDLTMRIVAAMWHTNAFESDIRSMSKIICSRYHSSPASIKNAMSERPFHDGHSRGEQDIILDDFLTDSNFFFRRVDDRELYLTTIESETNKTDVIIQASEPIAPGNFLAIDLNADANYMLESGMHDFESRVLMIAQTAPKATTVGESASYKANPYLHKAGVTLSVRFIWTAGRATALRAHTWDDSPLETFLFPLSSASCPGCQVQEKNAAEIRNWLEDLHKKGVEKISRQAINVEYQRRFGHGQVEFLPDVKDRAFIDSVLYRDEHSGYSIEEDSRTEHDPASGDTTENIA
ncbi:MAG: hypothetical protein OHK93_001223 [Ramalina farinacea]|uniref:Heterokaryon incompatibility domain-containing protein n=1 Tax=Ramalina farinacea TaxID=258253 RepID=A0AA43QR52_9LECA|nr:hypothetical protein [Ramalina farinacea]